MLENTKMDNTLVWADIPTRDLDRAMDFYSALLDVQVTPIQEEEMRFAMLRYDGSNAAACLGPMDKYHQPGGAGPLIYLSLGDRLQEAEQLVTRLGGRVGSTQMRLLNDEGTLIATAAAAYIVS